MPRVVILGTGTGVGKTYFTAALARALAGRDPAASVLALKPIETGVRGRRRDGSPAAGTDAATLEAASRSPAPRPHPLFSLRAPVSAHLAARGEQTHISIPRIARWASQSAIHSTTLHGRHWQLIETAGGAFSPLSRRATNVNLAWALDPAVWILVAPNALGVFHDVRATLLALGTWGRAPDFLVLSSAREPDAATASNAAEFVRVGLPRPTAILHRDGDPGAELAPLVRALMRRSAG